MVHTIPWCTVLSPPNVSGVSPGVYENQLRVWIPNGTTGAKWPVTVYCKRKDQALVLNTHLNPFLVYHGQEDDVTFRASLHEWQERPTITAMFDNDGATFWAIIYEHAVDQVDRSNPTYRRAHGFDKIENALICQMTSPTASPVGTPSKQKGKAHIPDSSPRKTHHGNYLTSNVTVNSVGNGDIFSSPTSHSSPRTPVSLGQAGPSRPRSMSPLHLPKLLARYLEVYQYPKRYVSRHLEEADTRDDFIEAVEESILEEAAGFIWDLGGTYFNSSFLLEGISAEEMYYEAAEAPAPWPRDSGHWGESQSHPMTLTDDFGDGRATRITLVQKSNKHSHVESKVSRLQKLGPVEVLM
ncbi:uncharacterized protein EV420DRAFT_1473545 [Desarmillaria tabescens]|uniref:Uncharacterized protein n=1 Tax=Armillaria tabescens TaxID=1929756 RepID=A0AA39NL86_ARMTA|nr:uncharacterized protein EV420DRAFT_1473545 [Desarmillaria tabescens]KAK0467687.1 hypothetical protein EV420DRAFT_1473545 [Desarmillaria tabescens]